MRLILAAILLASSAAPAVAAPAAGSLAQCGNAYTDLETAGPGGTYGSSTDCAPEQVAVPANVGLPGRDATARDNPDAPPVFRDTATFEGEREPVTP
jgi:hypothetical protein